MNESKQRIIRESFALFLQKSYKEVTMKDIVKKTGLSKGAFYHYFKGKEELFKEIANMVFSMGIIEYSSFDQGSLLKFFDEYLKNVSISFQKIENLFGQTEDENLSFNIFLIIFESIRRFPEFLELELELYYRELKAWEKTVSSARLSGEIKSQSSDRQIAELFLYCTDGVFIRFINNNKSNSYEEDLRSAFNTIYTNLKA